MNKVLNIAKKYKLVIGIVILLIAGGLVWRNQNQKNGQSSDQQQITAKTEKGNIISSISASGQVATANYLSVTTSVNGIVRQVYVKEGDKVVSGQKLMEITLDSEGEKGKITAYTSYLKAVNSLNSAKNSLVTLEASVAQMEETFEDERENNSYQTDDERVTYQTAESNYINAKNKLNEKKAEIQALQNSVTSAWLDYQTQSPIITAPSDGVIASVLAVEGSKIENSVSERSIQTVAAIKKEGTPIASLNLGEMDINNVVVGQRVNITLNSLDQKITGTVAGIDKVGTSSSGVTNYPVTVKFDKESDLVLPNMNVQAEIITAEKQDVLYIPTAAIQKTQGKSFVKVLRNGNTARVEVQTGVSNSDNTEIVGGLSEGDEVIVNMLPTEGFTSGQNQFGGGAFGGSVMLRR